ncbi:MAG: hypothetical protein H0T44_06840 [Gemmatimonadales bacterium]|nr:hypothetical protein [Gemmatimonadales bacterium]MDQ3426295.1 hypothetical protein [Gemmatimonadota bacterium]
MPTGKAEPITGRRGPSPGLLASAALTPIAFLGLLGYTAHAGGVNPAVLFQDPVTGGHLRPYTGVISNMGVVFWVATAGVCLFASWVLWVGNRRERAQFLGSVGLLTAILGVDDLFVFHELLAPGYLRVSERLVVAVYCTLLAGIIVRFRRELLSSADPLLGGALACLAGSLAVDMLAPNLGWYHLVEDGLKFIGITLWSTFYIRLACHFVRSALPGGVG